MVVKLGNNFRITAGQKSPNKRTFGQVLEDSNYITVNAKLLAWCIFLIIFIENGTLGLIPKQFYYIYRNMRISDFLIYGLILYSLFNVREFEKLFKSKLMIFPKLFLAYFLFQFIISSIKYDYNIIETFFRLKNLWMSFLVFPFLLLIKRKGLGYLIRIMLPVAIISNLLYILSALTGIAFLPDIGISEQNLPGGLKVFRVYGGTFYGELYFMGFIYLWITKHFRIYQLLLAILFIIPHILAFGRAAWIYLTLTIVFILIWYTIKVKEFRSVFKQIVIVSILVATLLYAFIQFIPQSEYFIDAIEARVNQGQDDFTYKEGTYGTRIANIAALLNFWQNGNIIIGIGMHPLWVLKPETVEESIIAWGFSDVGWASVLTAYGLIGFILAVLFQIFYFMTGLKILKQSPHNDILMYFIIVFLSKMFFDSVVNSTYVGLTVGLLGFYPVAFTIAAITYKYEYIDEEYNFSRKISS